MEYPEEVLGLLTPCSQQLTVASLQDMYSPVYSESGSNKRRAEEKVVFFWFRYIQDTADGQTGVSLASILMLRVAPIWNLQWGLRGKSR